MVLAFITFFSGLAISAVAIYYSVIGLAAIFAAAVIPIIVMGSILEVSKLVAAWWLKANWHRAPFLLKSYMLLAVVVLMLITSMGIFGFLSKAHTEQSVPVGDNQAKIQIIDERIVIEQEVIEQARRDLTILNQQVERFSELGAVTRGVNARNQQREERDALNTQITEAQTKISELRTERAPFAASLRAIEAEVGPIKYIAKLIYGDATDANMLEQAVVWIIIVIVFVFDPLAVLLLLASQMSFKWAREERELRSEQNAMVPVVNDTTEDSNVESNSNDDVEPAVEPVEPESEVIEITEEKLKDSPHQPGWAFSSPLADTIKAASKENQNNETQADEVAEVESKKFQLLPELEKELDKKERSALDEWNQMIAEAEKAVEQESESSDNEIIEEEESSDIKEAMHKWKENNPDDSLKHQRYLFNKGIIDKLPWEKYLKAQPDYEENEAALEAARWAEEQLEESKKKDSDLDGEDRGTADQENQGNVTGYVQNAEQNQNTLWQRVKNLKENGQ
jgi:hypothetical protein